MGRHGSDDGGPHGDLPPAAFLGALSHAIRSPLGVLKGAFDEVADSSAAQELGPLLPMVERNLAKLERLARDLMRVRDLEAGTLCVEAGPCDLGSLLRTSVGTQALRHRVDMDVQDSGPLVHADLDLLDEAVRRVLDNADRFAASRILIGTRADDDGVLLTIEDDGPGVEPERRERVFDRSLSAGQRGASGDLAFGLPIARELLRAMEGDVSLQASQSGLGGACCGLRLRHASEEKAP